MRGSLAQQEQAVFALSANTTYSRLQPVSDFQPPQRRGDSPVIGNDT